MIKKLKSLFAPIKIGILNQPATLWVEINQGRVIAQGIIYSPTLK